MEMAKRPYVDSSHHQTVMDFFGPVLGTHAFTHPHITAEITSDHRLTRSTTFSCSPGTPVSKHHQSTHKMCCLCIPQLALPRSSRCNATQNATNRATGLPAPGPVERPQHLPPHSCRALTGSPMAAQEEHAAPKIHWGMMLRDNFKQVTLINNILVIGEVVMINSGGI